MGLLNDLALAQAVRVQGKCMTRQNTTVEQVRESQVQFIKGYDLHEEKKYLEAIEQFRGCASINPVDKSHLEKLEQNLNKGTYKLIQKSIAYMGGAANHLCGLIDELTEDEKDEVPVDKTLAKALREQG